CHKIRELGKGAGRSDQKFLKCTPQQGSVGSVKYVSSSEERADWRQRSPFILDSLAEQFAMRFPAPKTQTLAESLVWLNLILAACGEPFLPILGRLRSVGTIHPNAKRREGLWSFAM
ncbi:hypothetical protein, partial [Burkholderia cenocepacia]|uniref:hypothetical protein n=1 Tax=Burkholderia cenocepacia TaxID=95486 RepID=UPI002ABD4942